MIKYDYCKILVVVYTPQKYGKRVNCTNVNRLFFGPLTLSWLRFNAFWTFDGPVAGAVTRGQQKICGDKGLVEKEELIHLFVIQLSIQPCLE